MPTPAGDYCFVFDIENREPLEARPLRNLDANYHDGAPLYPCTPNGRRTTDDEPHELQPTTAELSPSVATTLEACAALTSGMPMGPSPMGMPPMPPMPFMPPMTAPGTTSPGATPPADYSQQLFGYRRRGGSISSTR